MADAAAEDAASAPGSAPGAGAGPEIELAVEDPRWAEALGGEAALESLAREAAELALGAAGIGGEGRSVSFLFADDAALAELNGRFRGKARPTNVLSWPAFELRAEARGDADGAPPDPPPAPQAESAEPWDDEAASLGDVALAWETVAREAQAQGAGLPDHARRLALHGVLHLLGYDHEREGDAALMEGLERRALVAAGYADPYLAEDDSPAAPRAQVEEARQAAPRAPAGTAQQAAPEAQAEKARSDGL